jgi:hypothetical protein
MWLSRYRNKNAEPELVLCRNKGTGNGLRCRIAGAGGIGRWKYQLWELEGTFQTKHKKIKVNCTVQYIATYGKRKRSTFTAGNLAHLLVFIPARAHNVRNLIFCVFY